jgi:hypothetical protein
MLLQQPNGWSLELIQWPGLGEAKVVEVVEVVEVAEWWTLLDVALVVEVAEWWSLLDVLQVGLPSKLRGRMRKSSLRHLVV